MAEQFGKALSQLAVGPAFGFIAGWTVDRFGPRRLMIAGILMAGVAPIGLGSISTLIGMGRPGVLAATALPTGQQAT